MKITLSASGPLATVLNELEAQAQAQVSSQSNSHGPAAALLAHVRDEMHGVPDDAIVTVAGSIQIDVDKPDVIGTVVG